MDYMICIVEQKGLKRIEKKKPLLSFRGQFLHKISEQGRVSLPSNFKDALRNRGVSRLVVLKFPNFLRAFPEDEWEKQEKEYEGLVIDDERVNTYLHILFNSLLDIEVDTQGRLVLPENWRKELNLNEQIFILGKGRFFEIWNPQTHELMLRELMPKFSESRNYVVDMLRRKKQDDKD